MVTFLRHSIVWSTAPKYNENRRTTGNGTISRENQYSMLMPLASFVHFQDSLSLNNRIQEVIYI